MDTNFYVAIHDFRGNDYIDYEKITEYFKPEIKFDKNGTKASEAFTVNFTDDNIPLSNGARISKNAYINFKDGTTTKETRKDVSIINVSTQKELKFLEEIPPGTYSFKGSVTFHLKDLPEEKIFDDIESIQIYL